MNTETICAILAVAIIIVILCHIDDNNWPDSHFEI